ncbi:hypothetical protein VNI00_009904 [Paramarasmius palmivorus]|uniref:Glutamine amidotransferase type-2 domain-containing protein n=1 Tax=Paramarasmius palmivorus TaxID=297713 RepID=A0AAW0CQ26_9AGAR
MFRKRLAHTAHLSVRVISPRENELPIENVAQIQYLQDSTVHLIRDNQYPTPVNSGHPSLFPLYFLTTLMCGISAFKHLSASTVAEDISQLQDRLWASVKALQHRGPDSYGVYVTEDSLLGLGHARLSIIDIAGGQQPVHDSTNTIHAVVNGELYDYNDLRSDLESKGCQFQSSNNHRLSPEEPIIRYQTYGQNFIHHLRGEFAFVLYDSKRQFLIAARDRFGIKPLYHTVANGKLMLASEMKGLLPLGWQAEWDVESIMQMGEYGDTRTVFKGVYKVPAGHMLTCTYSGRIEVRPYWDHEYPHPGLEETRSVGEMIEGVRQRVIDAVRVRLRSDVPLCVYLSGGIDSAAVAGIASALLKEQNPDARLMTFTLAFPDRKDLDEGPIARRMAESIGAEVHMVAPTEKDLVDRFPKCIYHIEQPMLSFHGVGKMMLSEHVNANGYRVVLTGEGSDEIFGGYYFCLRDFLRAVDPSARTLGIPLPTEAELISAYNKHEAAGLRQDHVSLKKFSFQESLLGRDLVGGISPHVMISSTGLSDSAFTRDALNTTPHSDTTLAIAEAICPNARRKMCSGQWHPLHSALYTTSKTILQHILLNHYGDRVEMANSIEGRTPFLDHILVEYVNTIPPSLKIMPSLQTHSNGTNGANGHSNGVLNGHKREWKFTEKWILREAVKPFITQEIYERVKVQYNTPISRPVNGSAEHKHSPLQLMVKTKVTKDSVEKLGWACWEYLGGILREYLETPDCPVDGGLDRRARILLGITSYIILQEKFMVPAWTP